MAGRLIMAHSLTLAHRLIMAHGSITAWIGHGVDRGKWPSVLAIGTADAKRHGRTPNHGLEANDAAKTPLPENGLKTVSLARSDLRRLPIKTLI